MRGGERRDTAGRIVQGVTVGTISNRCVGEPPSFVLHAGMFARGSIRVATVQTVGRHDSTDFVGTQRLTRVEM